jgi:hypothetical protein
MREEIMPADKYEIDAAVLGFYRDENTGKWRHPDCREYATTKARYAVEDYGMIQVQKIQLAKANEPRRHTS